MGKRSKSSTSGDLKKNKKVKIKHKLEDNLDDREFEPVHLNTSIVKNVQNKNKKVVLESNTEPIEITTASQNKQRYKNKSKLHVNKQDQEEVFNEHLEIEPKRNLELAETSTSPASKKGKANKKNKANANKDLQTNNKIIFTDDEPVQVNEQTNNRQKTNKKDLPQEEDVKDEDIDKFCEEITEEDNVQYENWVKLIEAQLSSNKKKPK